MLGVAALVLAVLLAASHSARVAVKSILILPSAIAALPVDPLRMMTPSPSRESFGFDYDAGSAVGEVYAPGWGGRHGAILLLLGARAVELDNPTLVRFADGLSRAGAVVMVSASSELAVGRVVPEEVDAVARAVDLLRARDDVDPGRVGVIGFSVGGSVAILAAGDPRLTGKLAFVNAFGAFNDARDLVRAVATRRLAYAGVDEAWEPYPLTRWVFARQLVDTLPDPTDRGMIDRIYIQYDDEARADVERMTPVGRAALSLLDGASPEEVEAALEILPEATLDRLRGISPNQSLDRVTTRLFLMHDVGDRLIPYTESRRMVARATSAAELHHTEFNLFDHVTPNESLGSAGVVLELGKLFRQLHGVLVHVL